MTSLLKDGWFTEFGSLWPGQAMSLQIEEVLFEGKSHFQNVVIYKSKSFGKVLVLDGVIQLTERDWSAYQEMVTHIPLLSHPNPEKILVIGGGDGGVIGEALKHTAVKEVTLCEIDEMVVTTCKKFFTQFKWDDPRLKVVFADGAKFLEEHTNSFDIIIVDSSDPVGPAETLYTNKFYESLHKALLPGGVITQQAENVWLHLDIIERLVKSAKALFPKVDYAYCTIPTYPGGQIGFLFESNDAHRDFHKPLRTTEQAFAKGTAPLQYYNSAIHAASFVLPEFAAKRLQLK